VAAVKHRKSPRAKAHDYASPACYFVTVDTQDFELLFGDVVDAQVRLSDYGTIVRDEWLRTGQLRTAVTLDEFIVMPNHFHAILAIGFRSLARSDLVPQLAQRPYERLVNTLPMPSDARLPSLSTVLGAFKSAVSRRINTLRGTPGTTNCLRSFHDHIIRDVVELELFRDYIRQNPRRWAKRYGEKGREFDRAHSRG
jgi:REP element-mobilizing transposase RayT